MTARLRGKPLSQMNGDSLIHLRKPVSSEYRPDVRGNNASHRQRCEKQLELWGKERHLMVDRINRDQREVYKTMLNAHLMKKKIKAERMKERWKEERRKEEEEYRTKNSEIRRWEELSENETLREISEFSNLTGIVFENPDSNGFSKDNSYDKPDSLPQKEIPTKFQKIETNLLGNPFSDVIDSDLTRLITIEVDPSKDQSLGISVDNNSDTHNTCATQYQHIDYSKQDIQVDTDLNDQKPSPDRSDREHLKKGVEDQITIDNTKVIKVHNFKNEGLNEAMTTGVNSRIVSKSPESRVLEVRKGHRLEPMVRRRSAEKSAEGGEGAGQEGADSKSIKYDAAPGRDPQHGVTTQNKLITRKGLEFGEIFGENEQVREDEDKGENRRSVVTKGVTRATFTTIETVTKDADNQVVCVVQSCPPRAAVIDRQTIERQTTDRQSEHSFTLRRRVSRRTSSMATQLPAITEDEERAASRTDDVTYDVEKDNSVTINDLGGVGDVTQNFHKGVHVVDTYDVGCRNDVVRNDVVRNDVRRRGKTKLYAKATSSASEKSTTKERGYNLSTILPPIKNGNAKFQKRRIKKRKDEINERNSSQSHDTLPEIEDTRYPEVSRPKEEFSRVSPRNSSSTGMKSSRKKEKRIDEAEDDAEEKTPRLPLAPPLGGPTLTRERVAPSTGNFRNVFAPPSDRERRIRKRLVQAEQTVARQQKDKVDVFFSQMIETGHLEPVRKKPDPPLLPPVDHNKRKPSSVAPLPTNQMGGTLGALMAVFRQEYPGLNGREGTYEKLKRCRYLRPHEIMNETEREEARNAKTSSWDKSALRA